MPATLQSPFSHRLARRTTRVCFWLISLFQGPAKPEGEKGLPWQVKVILKILKLVEGPEPPSPQKIRKLYRLLTIPYHVSTATMEAVTDHKVPDALMVRLYRPRGIMAPTPALVYFHGGGGVVGDLETHDPLCRYLAAEAGMVVLAGDYRLNPEHKFPTQINDALAAFDWIRRNADELGIDATRIGAGGDSAGAYLAILLSHQFETQGRGPDFLWLVYPTSDPDSDTASRREFTEGLVLTTPLLDYFRNHAEGGEKLPSLADRDFPDCPPALLVTVGFDPLRDEGVALAARMKTRGSPVAHLHYPRLLHEFISMGGVVPQARAALDEAIDGLKVLAKA